jgi:hypothetical protein
LKKKFAVLPAFLSVVAMFHFIDAACANPTKELALNIALEMTPFFTFEQEGASKIFCYLASQTLNPKSHVHFSNKAEKLSPSLKFEIVTNPKQTAHCQFIFVDDEDGLFIQKTLPFLNKQSMIIGTNEEVLYQSGHVALLKMGNRFSININKKSMLMSNIRPSPQILSLAKIIIE